jgi:putative FmdB family regulatory protein
MPLFEYECRGCGHEFELLSRASEQPSCPSCHSHDLQKRLSVFAVGTAAGPKAPAPSAGPCGMCGDPRGPGSCSMN